MRLSGIVVAMMVLAGGSDRAEPVVGPREAGRDVPSAKQPERLPSQLAAANGDIPPGLSA
jgi:hypothetical protein